MGSKSKNKGYSRNDAKKDAKDHLDEHEDMTFVRQQQLHNLQFKINTTFKNKKQKELYNSILKNRITFVKGSPGTGKTLISLMAGLECLKNKQIPINQIILTKPIIEVSKSIGALPGDITEKTVAYYTHFYDNLIKIVGSEVTKFLKTTNHIKETLLNYLRGSTFGTYDNNGNPIGSFCIFDEAQNTTITELKTFISRIGENTKIVICGDLDQIDIKLNKNEISGFQHAWDILQGIDGIGFIEFNEDDIVREKLLIDIMKRYKSSKH